MKNLRMLFNNMRDAGAFFGRFSGCIKSHTNNKSYNKNFSYDQTNSRFWAQVYHFLFLLNHAPSVTRKMVMAKLDTITTHLEKSIVWINQAAKNRPKLTWAKAIQISAQYSPSLRLNLNHIPNYSTRIKLYQQDFFYILVEFFKFTFSASLRLAKYPYLFQQASYKIDQKGFIKFSKNLIAMYLIIFFAFSSIAGLFLFNPFGTKQAEATWFNDNWAFRKEIPASSTDADAQTNEYITFNMDTAALITAGKLQTSCQDIRITDVNGKILPRYIGRSTACNDSATVVDFLVPSIPVGGSTYYVYYGNPSAVSTDVGNLSWTAASNIAAVTLGSENAGPSPTLYWKFDEGGGSFVKNSAGDADTLTGLVGYWKMDEAAAATTDCSTGVFADSSGNANTGASCPDSNNGPLGGNTGKFGNGVTFDGTDDFIAPGVGLTNLASTGMTISTWIKPNLPACIDTVAFYDLANKGSGWEFVIFCDGGGSYRLWFTHILNAADSRAIIPITNGNWYHVTTTYSPATRKASLYLNGTELTYATQDAGSSASTDDGSSSVTIGAGINGASSFFNGTMDDTRAYNRALTPGQISALYSNAPEASLNNTPAWQTENMCVSAKCLWFDGTNNENVSKYDDPKLDFVAADNFTVSGWVKRNGISSANNYILAKSSAAGATFQGYKLFMDASGDLCFRVGDGTDMAEACTSTVDFDDDKWHFVSGVKAGTTSITLYVDGNSRATTTPTSVDSLDNTGIFYTGVDTGGTANEWLGFIDEVKVTRDQTARTAAQVLADFNARSNPEGVSSQQGNNIQNMPAALSNGLVGYWKEDEASDANATDSSGNGTTLTDANTVARAAGKFANGGDFELDNSEYQSAADNAVLSLTGSLTISAWIKPESVASGTHNIVAKWDGSNESYRLTQETDKIRLYLDSDSNYVEGATTLAIATWYHITGVYNSTNATAKIYINGAEVTVTTTGTIPSSITDDAGAFQIGAEDLNNTPKNFFDGVIDEARVYNRALSGAEVSQLYNWAPGPVGYWRFDERTGTTAYDNSSNANDLTLSTTSWAIGKYGSAWNGTGANWASRADDADFDFVAADNFSINLWVKSDSATNPANNEYLINKEAGTGYAVYFNTSGHLIFGIDSDGTWTPADTATAATDYYDGTWHHILAIKTGTSKIEIFIDGVLQGSDSTIAATGTLANADTLTIGDQDATDDTDDFNGDIDEPKIYNYARTAGQITEDMNAGHPAPGTPISSSVGWWKFNEGADNMCSGGTNDVCNSGSSGLTYDGISTADRTNSGKFSRALDFNGTDDVVTITNNNAIDFDTNLAAASTFSAWIYADTDGENDAGHVFSKDATNPSQTYIRVGGESGGRVNVEAGMDLATADATTSVTSAIATGTWNYVAMVYADDADDEIELYINGQLRNTSTNGDGVPTTSDASDLRIGNQNADTERSFDGKIDDFKVYNSALTASQITLDMNQGSGQVAGALSDNTTAGAVQAANQEYCIPGDSTTCTAPVGRWDLEEGTGTNAFDTSGNGNLGAITAGVGGYKRGKVGKSYEFDNADTLINAGTGATLDNLPAAGMTIEAWIYPESAGETSGFIMAKNVGTTPSAGWVFRLNSTTSLTFTVDGSTDLVRTTDTSLITQNAWNHVALTWDGVITTAATADIYINGREATYATTTNGADRVDDGTSTFFIGNDSTSARTFDGFIDQGRAFAYSRTPAQIAWDYNRGSPVAHWKMDECQGTTLNDSAGNSLTGTLTNAATPGTCTTSGSWFNGVTGKRNYSMDLDGSDDHIAVSDNDKISIDSGLKNGFTFATWVYPNSDGETDVGEIFDKGATTFCRTDSESASRVTITCSVDLTTEANFSATTTIPINQWSHVAFSWTNDADDEVTIWINGIANTSTATFAGDGAADANALTIGGTPNYDGQLDDFRIYNYELTTTQVKALMNEGAARYGPVTGAP